MLLERAAGLTAQIEKYEKLKNTADEAEKFQTRATQFVGLSEKLSQARRALENLAEAGVVANFTKGDGAGYASKANALRAALLDNPAAINDPPFNIKYDFVDRITAIIGNAEKAMAESWRAYVAKRADCGSPEVLTALAAIAQFQPSVAKIRQCRSTIEALGNSVPSDPKATVSKLDVLVAEHERAWAELSAEDIPSSVVSFIRAAASDGASLTSYSEEVKKWLDARNLTTAFRIRLK